MGGWCSDVCSSELRGSSATAASPPAAGYTSCRAPRTGRAPRRGCGCWASIRWRTPMVEPQYRAVFVFEIEFTNGGGLRGHDFRLHREGDELADAELVEPVIRQVRPSVGGKPRTLNTRNCSEN